MKFLPYDFFCIFFQIFYLNYVTVSSNFMQNVCSNFYENQASCFADVRQRNLIKNESNIFLKLVCVEIYSATITWTTLHEKKNNTFAIQISSAINQSIAIHLVNDTNEQDFLNLEAATQYHVLILLIASSGLVTSNNVAEMKFTTMPGDWISHPPSNLYLSNYIPINETVTDANISWSFMNGDLPCSYEIYWWKSNGPLKDPFQMELERPRSKEIIIPNLSYREKYRIKMAVLSPKISESTSIELTVPNCFRILNSSKCAIPKPENLNVPDYCTIETSKCFINISWTMEDFRADFYMVRIENMGSNGSDVSVYDKKNVTNTHLTVLITPKTLYRIKVYAFKNKGVSEPATGRIYVTNVTVKHEKESRPPLNEYYMLLGIVSIFALIMLIVLRIILVQRQHSSDNLKEIYVRIKHIEAIASNLDVKKPDHNKGFKYQLILGKMLGKGNFGVVFHGTLMANSKKVMDVAVKKLQENVTAKEIQQFEKEISLMEDVGFHNNIVSMIGSCYNARKPLLIVEYCSLGDLHTYLCDIKKTLVNFPDFKSKLENSYQNLITEQKGDENLKYLVHNKIYGVTSRDVMVPELSICDLLSFGRQVTIGMEYLASNYVVHRDLAARNVLLCSDKTVKISDFGLSRDIYAENIYRKLEGGERMPYKWMAIESIKYQEYTTQSDVWSFGVFLWELFTMGDEPYPDISSPPVLYSSLKEGVRLNDPCPSIEVYDVMLMCWEESPEQRPKFSTLYELLDQMLKKSSPNQYITITGNENERF